MHVQRQIDELLALRASEWLDVLQTAGEAERKEFAEWLSESRLHVQAFLEVAEIEFSLHRMDRARQHDIELLVREAAPNVVPLGRPAPTSLAPEPDGVRSRPPLRWRAWHVTGLIAACLSMAAIALSVLYYTRGPDYSTAVGEQKTVELADMSVITLNALSKIEVNLDDVARDVQLVQGEALFTVAHDPDRPFKVHTRAGVVQAVGTQFNVYDRPNGDTRVSVLEGRVQLTSLTGQEAPQILGAAEEADIRLDGTIQKNENAVVANTVAWRARLVFDNATLEDMIAEFNRYNPSLRLRLDGIPAASAPRYTGVFNAADPASFLDLLSKESDLIVERGSGEVVLRPRATATTESGSAQ